MSTFKNIRPLFKSQTASETGIVWTKAQTIASGDFDKFLYEIDDALWTPDDIFGQIMIVDTTPTIYTVEIELKNENNGVPITKIITVPAWVPIFIQGTRIIAAGTNATTVTIFGGQ